MKPKSIHQAVKEFKEQNGNANFTQKDLTIYILHKLDLHDKRFDEGCQEFISKDIFIKVIFAVCAVFGGVVGYCFKLVVDILKHIGG